MRHGVAALLAVAAGLAGCEGERHTVPQPEESLRAQVTLESTGLRTEPSFRAPLIRNLARGTDVRVRELSGGFARVFILQKTEGWVPAWSIERLASRRARLERSNDDRKLPVQQAVLRDRVPVLLAPDFGAAQWTELQAGERVDVVTADHDFFGIRLPGLGLAFIPARSVSLGAPRKESPATEVEEGEKVDEPEVRDQAGPANVEVPEPLEEPKTEAPHEGPYEALPAGAIPPVVVHRVDPEYPESARRARVSGEVVLKILVEADGRVSSVEVEEGLPMGLSESASSAVERWVYAPARVEGKPVAVYSRARVRFSLQ